MPLMKSKLRITAAFAAQASLALAVSCRGFFVKPKLTTVTVDPTTPSVNVGSTKQMFATGTFDDNSTETLSSGTSCSNNSVCWSETSNGTVITISAGGLITGVATGTSTVTAQSGAISGSTTVTVVLVVSSISINPSSASITAGQSEPFTVSAVAGGKTIDITSSATLTPKQNGTAVSTITCSYNSSIPAQVCNTTAGTTTPGTYQIVASYSGSNLTSTANLTVN